MSTRSSSASDDSVISFQSYAIARARVPSLQSVEDLMQLNLAVQQELDIQLSSLRRSVEKDLEVTKRLVNRHAALGARNYILDRAHEVATLQQEQSDRAAELRAKGDAIRDRYIDVKRQLSTIKARTDRNMLKIDQRQAALAKADKLLNEAGRIVVKAEIRSRGPRTPMSSPL